MNRKVLLIGSDGITLALGLAGCSSSKKTASTPSSAAPPARRQSASSAPLHHRRPRIVTARCLVSGTQPRKQRGQWADDREHSSSWARRRSSRPALTASPASQKNYGVTFGSFKPLDDAGPVTIAALKNGQVDAADIFSTDPSIAANNFVVLADPKSNFAAQNVLPLINKAKATDGVKSTSTRSRPS